MVARDGEKMSDPVKAFEQALLANRRKQAASLQSLESELIEAAEAEGLRSKDRMTLKGRTLWFSDGVGEVLVYETNRGTFFNYNGKEYRSVKALMMVLEQENNAGNWTL
jgi:hypothetical protein